MTTLHRRAALCLALVLSLLAFGASPALADEPERPTLRERLQQRRAERAAARETSASAAAPLAAGTQEQTVVVGGQVRHYLVHVPATLNRSRPVPVVLAFHGGGGHAAYMADDSRYGLVSAADRDGYVVVFPNGYSRFPGGRLATWNAGGCCGEARDQGSDDVAFVRALLARLRTQLPVDEGRIFATGMSNGGMFSHRLACEMADTFRAIAAVAGTEAVADCRPARPISVLHLHARDDDHVLYAGGAGPQAFRDASKVMDFVSVPETMARWVQRNQCASDAQRTLSVPGAQCDTWRGCAGGVQVRLCSTDTGGHSWPGAETVRRGKPAASTALDANATIWAFFQEAAAAR